MKFIIESLTIPFSSVRNRSRNLDTRLVPFIAEYCGMHADDIITYEIVRKSVDARRKQAIRFIYRLIVDVRESPGHIHGMQPYREPAGPHPLDELSPGTTFPNPIIVGTGPAGLSAAYLLARYGCRPIVLDRGYTVERRGRDIAEFLESRTLNPDSNYLVGEGGAGTYSDGKLYTRSRNPNTGYLLDLFAGHGAPREITYLKRPHIGSDILPAMVTNIRKTIESLGGRFIWGTEITDIIVRSGVCAGVRSAKGEQFEAPRVVVAAGHSARTLISALTRRVRYSMKDFQIGCRIEHEQQFINTMQYGLENLPDVLDPAEYNLVSRPAAHTGIVSTATFCMCPGGTIIPATSHPGLLCTNGMSGHRRAGRYANSGLIVSQPGHAFKTPTEAYSFIEATESAAFSCGGSDYTAPAQGAAAFVRGERGLPRRESSYAFGVRPARLDELLPPPMAQAIKAALAAFEHKHPGFASTGTLIGVETRVSSPVRFTRDPATLLSSMPGLYLAGEGAGYGSGIISAALDGLRIAEKIITER